MSAGYYIGDKFFPAGGRTLVMGILNVTPDSFSDGGRFDEAGAAHDQALRMIAEGADIVDIGGESTRPGHTPVKIGEELDRILPVIRRLAAETSVPISVDTFKADVAAAALDAGAVVVNDVWGLQHDPAMAGLVAERGVTIVAMHNRDGADETIDILAHMAAFFEETLERARSAGVDDSRIILDPGIGFGKTAAQNVEVLSKLDVLDRFELPILVGTSRKSMFGKLLGLPVDQRLNATVASNVLAVAKGAEIVRVHDVREHVEACRFADLVLRG